MKVVIFIVFIFISSLDGAFMNESYSSHIRGMGNVFTGVANNIDGITINPSSIGGLDAITFKIEGNYPYFDKSEVTVLKLGIKGGMPLNMKVFNLGLGLWSNYFNILNTYAEMVMGLTGGIKWKNLKTGISVKYLHLKYYFSDYLTQFFNKDSSGRLNIDWGADISFFKYFRSGISLINLIPTKIGIRDKERLATMIKYGLSYMRKKLIIAGEVSSRFQQWKDFYKIEGWGFGIERKINNSIKFRMGINSNEVSIGSGYSFYIKNKLVVIDYAFLYYYLSLTEHTLSIGFRI